MLLWTFIKDLESRRRFADKVEPVMRQGRVYNETKSDFPCRYTFYIAVLSLDSLHGNRFVDVIVAMKICRYDVAINYQYSTLSPNGSRLEAVMRQGRCCVKCHVKRYATVCTCRE